MLKIFEENAKTFFKEKIKIENAFKDNLTWRAKNGYFIADNDAKILLKNSGDFFHFYIQRPDAQIEFDMVKNCLKMGFECEDFSIIRIRNKSNDPVKILNKASFDISKKIFKKATYALFNILNNKEKKSNSSIYISLGHNDNFYSTNCENAQKAKILGIFALKSIGYCFNLDSDGITKSLSRISIIPSNFETDINEHEKIEALEYFRIIKD